MSLDAFHGFTDGSSACTVTVTVCHNGARRIAMPCHGGCMQGNQAVYCQPCEAWLNGPNQYRDHLRGKKHRSKMKKKPQPAPPEKRVVRYSTD